LLPEKRGRETFCGARMRLGRGGLSPDWTEQGGRGFLSGEIPGGEKKATKKNAEAGSFGTKNPLDTGGRRWGGGPLNPHLHGRVGSHGGGSKIAGEGVGTGGEPTESQQGEEKTYVGVSFRKTSLREHRDRPAKPGRIQLVAGR